MMPRVYFTPVPGEIYKNQNGALYRCLWSNPDSPGKATMQNVRSGWTMIVIGCGLYDDGTMDWDYSTDGYFARPVV